MSRHVVELVNRTDKAFEFMFDGVGYIVPAKDTLDVTEDAAFHGYKNSIMAYDLETGKATYQIGIKGIHAVGYIGAGKDASDELIDRETDIAGTPQKINVRGGQSAPSREGDALAGDGAE